MGVTNKRIAIARAIMYKELAKRNAERERECKRRGLWTLWLYQDKYKTLWHFLRASDERLIMLCEECISDLQELSNWYLYDLLHFSKCNKENPCTENERQLNHYDFLYHKCVQSCNEITIIKNNLTGGINNENQN